jgi:L-amino acid N-acyltransferase YncA
VVREKVIIRIARLEDVPAIQEIYAPYVKETMITSEYDVPSIEEFQERMTRTQQKYPYLVAEYEGEVLGYAYTNPFVGRAAYGYSAVTSIYVRRTGHKLGLGRKLYEAIEKISARQHIRNLMARIGYTDEEHEYLNKNSAQFHEKMGYQLAGRFPKSGYKFGQWYDIIWMVKHIAEHTTPEEFIPFPELPREALEEAGVKVK